MKSRLLYILLSAGVLAVASLAALTLPAAAQKRVVYVKLVTGEVVAVVVEVPPDTSLDDIELPGDPVEPGTPSDPPPSKPPTSTAEEPGAGAPDEDPDRQRTRRKRRKATEVDESLPVDETRPRRRHRRRTRLRNPDGSPTTSNPGFIDALPGPSSATGVPNLVIEKFRVPPFLLSIYIAAGIEYGVRWEVLAAINEIETDYGRNLNVSSAGAIGWMQFIPSSWRRYGVDANQDGQKDPYNPVDAIFAAARYLAAAGYSRDPRRAIFAYNHANWYVDSVQLRARLIAGVPADLVGSLTGLTEGRFPVYGRARYADDLSEREQLKRVKRGQNAANVVESEDDRRGVEIYARARTPAVAVNDGVIKKVGYSKRHGRFVVLQDVYGNRYLYGRLGSIAKYYPVPKEDALDPKRTARAVKANADDPRPTAPASAGRQPDDSDRRARRRQTADAPQASVPIKERLFAHPGLPQARKQGGLEQLLDRKARRQGGFTTYRNYFSRPFGLDSDDVRLRRLKRGSHVIGGTILGRIGRTSPRKASHLYFEIRPAGRGAPRIDPKPILDGLLLLANTKIYRANGTNALYGDDAPGLSIGQIMLLDKPRLEKFVLADSRIEVYPCGRQDIRSGQIDRSVLFTLAYLSQRGFRTTVTSLKCGHGFYTSTGNVSHHSSGHAVDIAKVNGMTILGHQEPGGITDQVITELLKLQGTRRPDQIISLRERGGPSFAMADHADHIHVGFRPLFGANRRLGLQAAAVLKPGQWSNLLERLRDMPQPEVLTKTSKYAIPVKKKSRRASHAHRGE